MSELNHHFPSYICLIRIFDKQSNNSNVCAMLLLAVDQSTRFGSLAVLADDQPMAAISWDGQNPARRDLSVFLPHLMNAIGFSLDKIELFCVGLGPGCFSGLRMSLASFQAMALPTSRPVIGVPSCEALAWEIGLATGKRRVAVAGDARRGRLWVAVYEAHNTSATPLLNPCLVVPEALAGRVAGIADMLVSPHGEAFLSLAKRNVRDLPLISAEHGPTAESVGVLGYYRFKSGPPKDPPRPIYMHPPTSMPAPRRE